MQLHLQIEVPVFQEEVVARERMKALRVLVTGASSGVGKAVAIQLARQGHSLYITGRDNARLSEASELCKGAWCLTVRMGKVVDCGDQFCHSTKQFERDLQDSIIVAKILTNSCMFPW